MAKPYRRRKGKTGPFVGNYRVTVDGRDLNLKTKDAREAMARARLAVLGKWPPEEAAVRAAVNTVDPGASLPGLAGVVFNSPRADAGEAPPESGPAGGPSVADPVTAPAEGTPAAPEVPGSGAASEQPPPSEPPEQAARAAAAEAAGEEERVTDARAEQERQSQAELDEVMKELTGGAAGGEFIDGVAGMCAGALLWMERKSLELGWGWTLRGRTGKQLVTYPTPPDSFSHKALRVGLKAWGVMYFPELSTRLTPGWAIALGLITGGIGAVAGGDLVDVETGERRPLGDVMAAAQAQAAAAQPNGAPSVPAAA